MRLSTQSLQKKLTNNKKSGTKRKLPIGISVLLALLAGASFSWSLAPYNYWIIAIVSPALLYVLLLPEMSNKKAFIIGEAYGIGLWAVGAFWLYTSIHTYGNTPIPLALLAIAGMAILMGLFHGLLAVIFNRFVGKQPFAFASIWVLQEWLKTWVLTGFPWLFVGYAFTEQAWLSSYAPIFGIFAISFIAILTATSVVEIARKRAIFILPVLLLLLGGFGLSQVDPQWTTAKQVKPLKVSLLQGNIPQDLKWLTEYQNETLKIYADLSSSEWEQDVIIWPESSIPMFQTQALEFIIGMAEIAHDTDTTWVTGVPFKDDEAFNPEKDAYPPFYNSVVSLGADAQGLYKKQRLVPFGEYIPFEGALNLFPDLAGSQDIMSYRRGSEHQIPLKVQGYNMGAAVCYEIAYPETTRQNAKNTDFLLTISNDAWFGTSAGPLQHLQMVQMRSLETGRWFLRATNTGVTAIINEKGEIISRAPQFERTVLRGEVQPRAGETPFMKMGQKPILIFSLLLLILSILGQRAKIKAIQGSNTKSSTDINEINKRLEEIKRKQDKP